jgi:Kef-type K+ transport system membrane component KefB
MFLAGWELDLARLGGRGRAVGGLSVLSMAVPFVLGAGCAALLYASYGGGAVGPGTFALYLGTAFSITAFPVLARIIADGRLSRTRVGTMAMACAAVGDVLAWCALVLVVALTEATGVRRFVAVLALTLGYALVMLLVVRPLLGRLLTHAVGRRGYGGSLVAMLAAAVFLSSYATSWIGIHAIFGAFALGLVMPRDLPRRELQDGQLQAPLARVAALLLPVFFIVTGLSVDVGALGWSGALVLFLVLATAVIGKVAGTLLPARLCGMSWRESTGFAMLMNTRGLTEIVILDVGRQLDVISAELFTMMVLMALATTAMAGPVLHGLGLAPESRTDVPHRALHPIE